MEPSQSDKLKELLGGLKENTDPSYVRFNSRQVEQELEDLVYFVNKAIKYRDTKSIAQASIACSSLGTYLAQYGGK